MSAELLKLAVDNARTEFRPRTRNVFEMDPTTYAVHRISECVQDLTDLVLTSEHVEHVLRIEALAAVLMQGLHAVGQTALARAVTLTHTEKDVRHGV